MKGKYKFLSKNVLLFSISGFLPRVISFVMIPFYTYILTPTDYGISEMITTTVALLLPIFTCDIQDAVLRYTFDKRYSQSAVFSVAISIIIRGCLLVVVACLGVWLLDIPGIKAEYLCFIVWQYIVMALQNSCNLFCRGINKIAILTLSSLWQAIFAAGLNILFLAVFPLGLTGYMLANSLSATVALSYVIVAAKLYIYVEFEQNYELKSEMMQFSLPLIFSVLAWWVNNVSDRYIITWMVGLSASGLYAVSLKIPTILVVFENIFYQAWSISAIKDFDKQDQDGFISKMYTMTNTTMVILCSLIMCLNIPIANILYAKDFFPAWEYVPPLLISIVFNANALFVGSIYTAVKKTRILSYTTISGALVNTVLNVLLIWCMGVYGAAWATMIGYAVVAFARLYYVSRFITLHVNFLRDMLSYALLIGQAVIAHTGVEAQIFQVALLCGIVVLFYSEIKLLINQVIIKIR